MYRVNAVLMALYALCVSFIPFNDLPALTTYALGLALGVLYTLPAAPQLLAMRAKGPIVWDLLLYSSLAVMAFGARMGDKNVIVAPVLAFAVYFAGVGALATWVERTQHVQIYGKWRRVIYLPRE